MLVLGGGSLGETGVTSGWRWPKPWEMTLRWLTLLACFVSALQAQTATLTPFATFTGSNDLYHITEAPNGTYVVARYSSSSLFLLSADGRSQQRLNGGFIFPTSVAFYTADVGYSACNPAPLASRSFCFSGSTSCVQGIEGVSPGNISGISFPRYVLAPGALTAQRLFVANGGSGEIVRVDVVSRNIERIVSGFTQTNSTQDPRGLEQMAFSAAKNTLYVVDSAKNTVSAVDPTARTQRTIVTGMNYPFGLVLMQNGNLLIANRGDGQLIETTTEGAVVNRYDSGLGANALRGLLATTKGDVLLVSDKTLTIYRVALSAAAPTPATVTSVNAASFKQGGNLAPDSIASAFGVGLATGTAAATTAQLPTNLAGTTVLLRDSANNQINVPLFIAAPGQINLLLPANAALGAATLTVNSADGQTQTSKITLAAVAPGLFTSNSDGVGVPAGFVVRTKADSTQTQEPVAMQDPATNRFIPKPLTPPAAGETLTLVLFGTGIRGRAANGTVTATVGGVSVPVVFAGRQGGFSGLDQVNVNLPASLAGRGSLEVIVSVDGVVANTVVVAVQ